MLIPAAPTARRKSAVNSNSPARLIPTVTAEKTTVRPALAIVAARAVRTCSSLAVLT